jgi:hypothetical protein
LPRAPARTAACARLESAAAGRPLIGSPAAPRELLSIRPTSVCLLHSPLAAVLVTGDGCDIRDAPPKSVAARALAASVGAAEPARATIAFVEGSCRESRGLSSARRWTPTGTPTTAAIAAGARFPP